MNTYVGTVGRRQVLQALGIVAANAALASGSHPRADSSDASVNNDVGPPLQAQGR
jgi:hypothetical protein